MFTKGGLPDEIAEVELSFEQPVWLAKLLVEAGLVKSTSDGRRMIKQGAVSLDSEKATDEKAEITPEGELLVKVGKRRFAKVIFS